MCMCVCVVWFAWSSLSVAGNYWFGRCVAVRFLDLTELLSDKYFTGYVLICFAFYRRFLYFLFFLFTSYCLFRLYLFIYVVCRVVYVCLCPCLLVSFCLSFILSISVCLCLSLSVCLCLMLTSLPLNLFSTYYCINILTLLHAYL